MFTKKHNVQPHAHLDGGLLTGAVGKALVMAALLSGAAAPMAQAAGAGCRPAAPASGTDCTTPPAGSIQPAGGLSGGVLGK
jgi:hypothetical protein